MNKTDITKQTAEEYGKPRLEEIVKYLENQAELKNTAPYLQFKELLNYLSETSN